jgi:hypothetical protein
VASISTILRIALRLHAPQPYPEHLRSALRSRAVVDAAVSLIMLQNRCGRDHAMELLQLASRTSDRRLHEIAADILDRANDGPPVPPHELGGEEWTEGPRGDLGSESR